MEFSDLSKSLTKNIDKKEKKNNGIFFTPKSIINKNLELLQPYMKNINNILEPSCGSCEYIISILSRYKNKNITGIELNENIYEKIKELDINNTELLNENFLEYEGKKYDLIIGNPPYYVLKKNKVNKKYWEYITGRPNIFLLFIIKSLELLNDDGILSFILPNNFKNSIYYNKLREYIDDNLKIINIEDCNDSSYLETKQDTFIFIIQKKKSRNKKYTLKRNNNIIFNTKSNIKRIKQLYENSKTLSELNFKAYVGNVVWNQCKDILTSDKNKTRLLYSSNIKDNKIVDKEYKDPLKKNYIDKKGIRDIILVINRGYGKGKYKFNYCLINVDYDYLIENHLIGIRYNKKISKKNLIKKYEKLIISLNDKRTREFIDIYFENNAINTNELNNILPIYTNIM